MVGPATDLSLFHLYSIRRFGMQHFRPAASCSLNIGRSHLRMSYSSRHLVPSRGAGPFRQVFDISWTFVRLRVCNGYRSRSCCRFGLPLIADGMYPQYSSLWGSSPYRSYNIYNFLSIHDLDVNRDFISLSRNTRIGAIFFSGECYRKVFRFISLIPGGPSALKKSS